MVFHEFVKLKVDRQKFVAELIKKDLQSINIPIKMRAISH